MLDHGWRIVRHPPSDVRDGDGKLTALGYAVIVPASESGLDGDAFWAALSAQAMRDPDRFRALREGEWTMPDGPGEDDVGPDPGATPERYRVIFDGAGLAGPGRHSADEREAASAPGSVVSAVVADDTAPDGYREVRAVVRRAGGNPLRGPSLTATPPA